MKKIVVIGGGLAGLSAAMRVAERGCQVMLVAMAPARRSHSVCAQGGINAAVNLKNEGDSPLIHAYETIKGGDFLADQPPVVAMCEAAPGIIQMFDRLGCPFNRTEEGCLDFRLFGGTHYHRTAFCGASTGQQLVYALDEQVRRHEAEGRVQRYEHHEFMRLVIDENGVSRGVVMMNLYDLSLEVIASDAVILATGGPGMVYKQSTNSALSTGAAVGRLYRQGLTYANAEFIQIHPTAIPGTDKLRLISESVRGEGGRLFVMGDSNKTITTTDGREIPCGKTGERWYFLEELYPAYGNLVPRDIGAREIVRVCEMGLGVDGKNMVQLDVTHLPQTTLHKVEAVLDIYTKFTGEDPRKVPMRVFPAVHYSMGGAWVDYRQMSNIPNLFCAGEVDFAYHGANRLGANSLLSCVFAGLAAAGEVIHCSAPQARAPCDDALAQEERRKQELLGATGSENVHRLHDRLGEVMVKHVSVKRNNVDLQKTLHVIQELKERYHNVSLDDRETHLNQTFMAAHQFEAQLDLAYLITTCALLRNESRGAHFKPEYPKRDDVNWLKTTLATYNPQTGEPIITYKPVDLSHFKPEERDYTR